MSEPTRADLVTVPCPTCGGAYEWCDRHKSVYINDGYCDYVLDTEGVTPENMDGEACGVDCPDCTSEGYVIPTEWLEADHD